MGCLWHIPAPQEHPRSPGASPVPLSGCAGSVPGRAERVPVPAVSPGRRERCSRSRRRCRCSGSPPAAPVPGRPLSPGVSGPVPVERDVSNAAGAAVVGPARPGVRRVRAVQDGSVGLSRWVPVRAVGSRARSVRVGAARCRSVPFRPVWFRSVPVGSVRCRGRCVTAP